MICLLAVTGMFFPAAASAQTPDQKVVRVGWYESAYCNRDKYGERRGIAYEYQRRIAAYTGWTYEYVEDSWPNLLQMLIDGEIDLMSDVSYTEERSKRMLFPSIKKGIIDLDKNTGYAEALKNGTVAVIARSGSKRRLSRSM